MYFDDIRLHTQITIPPIVIEKQKMLDFARLYDNIPLHMDEVYAQTTPFALNAVKKTESWRLRFGRTTKKTSSFCPMLRRHS